MIKSFKIFILTHNDEDMIDKLLHDLEKIETVIIIDSFSTDKTVNIAKKFGREVHQNVFVNQAVQSNWAIDNFFDDADWILRLDSDERVSEALLAELDFYAEKNSDCVVYIDRYMHWMDKKLKYSGLRPHYIGRFFKRSFARYEEVTEEHLLHQVPTVRAKTKFFEYNVKNSMKFWLDKHYQTALGEVHEYKFKTNIAKGNLFSVKDFERKRWLKLKLYNSTPFFLRPLIYFLHRYVFKFGFLDGKAGLSYCFFQAFFYRMLVDQLILESEQLESSYD